MEQSDKNHGLNSEDIGPFLRKVVDDWRLDQRKSIRHRLVDFEDSLERMDSSELPDAEDHRLSVEEARDLYKSRLDDRYAMIEEMHRQMVKHLDRCEQGAA